MVLIEKQTASTPINTLERAMKNVKARSQEWVAQEGKQRIEIIFQNCLK